MNATARLLACTLILSPLVHAQVSTGSITGSVQDPSGASVVDAAVTVTNTGTNGAHSGASSSAGNYLFLLLPPGTYTLSVASPGFKEFRREGLIVKGDRALSVPVSLTLGSASETVEVTAGTVLLDAPTSELGAVVNNTRIVNLPMNGRNPLFLANLTPTVKGVGLFGQDVVGSWTEAAVGIGGGNALSNAYLVDGLSNNKLGDSGGALSFLEVSNTEEFKVITNAMAAEYGQTGGGIISVIGKYGTNQ